MRTPVRELARERESEPLGASADVAVLAAQTQSVYSRQPIGETVKLTLPAGLKWSLRLKRPIASADRTTTRTAAATAPGAALTADEMAPASLALSSKLIQLLARCKVL